MRFCFGLATCTEHPLGSEKSKRDNGRGIYIARVSALHALTFGAAAASHSMHLCSWLRIFEPNLFDGQELRKPRRLGSEMCVDGA